MPLPDFFHPSRPIIRDAMQWTQSAEYESQFLYWSTVRPILIDCLTIVGYLILAWWALCSICRFLGLANAFRRSLLLATLLTSICSSMLQMANPLKPWLLSIAVPLVLVFLLATILAWRDIKSTRQNFKLPKGWFALLEPAALSGLTILAVLLFATKRLVVFEYPEWWKTFIVCSLLTLLCICAVTAFAMKSAWFRSRQTSKIAGEDSEIQVANLAYSLTPNRWNLLQPQATQPVSPLPPLLESHQDFFRLAAQSLIVGSLAIGAVGWWPTGWGIDPNGVGNFDGFTRLQFGLFSFLWWFSHGVAILVFLIGLVMQQLAGLTLDRFGRLIANYLTMALVIPIVLQTTSAVTITPNYGLLRYFQ